MGVHPTAIVEDGAKLGADVEIGPFCTVGDGVVLGDGCRVGPNACLEGPLELLLGDAGGYITGVTLPVDGGHLVRPL